MAKWWACAIASGPRAAGEGVISSPACALLVSTETVAPRSGTRGRSLNRNPEWRAGHTWFDQGLGNPSRSATGLFGGKGSRCPACAGNGKFASTGRILSDIGQAQANRTGGEKVLTRRRSRALGPSAPRAGLRQRLGEHLGPSARCGGASRQSWSFRKQGIAAQGALGRSPERVARVSPVCLCRILLPWAEALYSERSYQTQVPQNCFNPLRAFPARGASLPGRRDPAQEIREARGTCTDRDPFRRIQVAARAPVAVDGWSRQGELWNSLRIRN